MTDAKFPLGQFYPSPSHCMGVCISGAEGHAWQEAYEARGHARETATEVGGTHIPQRILVLQLLMSMKKIDHQLECLNKKYEKCP